MAMLVRAGRGLGDVACRSAAREGQGGRLGRTLPTGAVRTQEVQPRYGCGEGELVDGQQGFDDKDDDDGG